jgi:RNA polymerase sigma factor (sigma-70 family)
MVELDITLLVDSDIETDYLHKELINFLTQKIKESKEPDRTILILKYQHGLKNKEIADKLNLTQNVVDIRLSRQRTKFKKMLLEMEV